ncbi:hypothetical protein [Mesorhizobium huakuii]|uniref:hypothetical protein n=1 Tax=Mesorhizobium huakuii TaxID=28104 RepID=UPI0024E06068|nr:hypothetical protein [Mesorhizobium huakuii]
MQGSVGLRVIYSADQNGGLAVGIGDLSSSLAIASLFLPFLPLLATQILLQHFFAGDRHRQCRYRSAAPAAALGYRLRAAVHAQLWADEFLV